MVLAKRTPRYVAEGPNKFANLARLDLDRHCRYQFLIGCLDDRDGTSVQ